MLRGTGSRCVAPGDSARDDRASRTRRPRAASTVRRPGSIKDDSLIVRTKRSAYALRFGERGGRRTVCTPAVATVSRKVSEKSGSRSCSRKRVPREEPTRVGQVATALGDPGAVGVGHEARDLRPGASPNASRRKPRSASAPSPSTLHGQEIRGCEDVPVRPEKLLPCRRRMFAIVLRATRWCRLASAPWRRV